MRIIPYPSSVDFNQFNLSDPNPSAKYGLPKDIKFCKKCVMSNQLPSSAVEFLHTIESKKKTMPLNEKQVCDACRFNEAKATSIDWTKRERELKELCERFRSEDGSYDCIVPGSGGKDSFYAAHMLKYKYGMHPLTITWAPHIYTECGWHNFQAWVNAGFDNILHTPNPRVHRLLTRLAVDNLLHPFQPFILGQKHLAYKLSIRYNIPLVFYGENSAEYNTKFSEGTSASYSTEFCIGDDFNQLYFGGASVSELNGDFGLSYGDLAPYLPVNTASVGNQKVEIYYLGYYLPWHPQGCFYYAVEHGGFRPSPERTVGTYSKYNSIDDKIDDFHYYTTYIKFGLGRASYDASQEIRNNEINREEGVALVRKYDGEWPERFADEIFRYLSIPSEEYPIASKMFEQPIMDKEYFTRLCDNFRSPHLWERTNGEWRLRHSVFAD